MALGQTMTRESYRPSLYGVAFRNETSTAVDRTMISFSMWASTIKVSIYPLVEDTLNNAMTPDFDAGGSIWLTPSKAMMFAGVIKKFTDELIQNPDKKNSYSGWSVSTKQGLIGIYDKFDMNSTGPCIVLKKVNVNGKVESSYAYETKIDYYDIISEFNEADSSFKRNTTEYQFIELMMIANQLNDYSRASNNAYAFAVADSLAYNLNQLHENIVRIGKNMGIDMIMPKGSKTGGGVSQSFFDKNHQSTSVPSAQDVQKKIGSIDDIINA